MLHTKCHVLVSEHPGFWRGQTRSCWYHRQFFLGRQALHRAECWLATGVDVVATHGTCSRDVAAQPEDRPSRAGHM